MTTDQAFERVISNVGVGQILGISSQQVRNYRRLFKARQLSEKRKHRILELAGWKMVQEPRWGYPYGSFDQKK